MQDKLQGIVITDSTSTISLQVQYTAHCSIKRNRLGHVEISENGERRHGFAVDF